MQSAGGHKPGILSKLIPPGLCPEILRADRAAFLHKLLPGPINKSVLL